MAVSHIFRLRLRSCSELFEPGYGSETPSPKNFQIFESDSCSDSGYHRRNRHSAIFYLGYVIYENQAGSCC